MSQTGSCLCGAVTYSITNDITETGACHCEMCRRWSGGVFLGMEVPGDDLKVNGSENLTVYASSPWAERAFCKKCGSSMWYRVTAPGPHHNTHHIGLGTMDDASGVTLTGEIFIDKKPDGYSFAGDTHKMTAAEMMALFGGGPD
ncbi:GFA family protein [uncultured Roseobacter sp.]|uniref:GFA family protein n=1 Tax=uncultured Roseobacter sp. TaxID=114847 RepID=UPI0026342C2F|nr:GFA family protein [uncultured Roseobacter sp.]